jgi:hypothetical protein
MFAPVKKEWLLVGLFSCCFTVIAAQQKWQSQHVKIKADGTLRYIPDAQGNIIPDFSRVGYFRGDKAIPYIPVVKTLLPGSADDDRERIQAAIDEVSAMKPGRDGFRGAVLLKKGGYKIKGTIKIDSSGIVLRGEGNETKLLAVGNEQHTLIAVSGSGALKELPGTRVQITDAYTPVGTTAFTVSNVAGFKTGDPVILFRPGTAQWISDLKMDRIEPKSDTKQRTAAAYNGLFERIITGIKGNTIYIDNPVVMAMEARYGGGEIFKYSFDGRISKVGIEEMYVESEFETDTSENHGWDAISLNRIENGWVRNVTARYFGYSCVNLGDQSKWITVDQCASLDAKSLIIGGRRYSFNNDGQMNLFMNCRATEGRHDYVTGAKVCGPNVFYNCTAENAHADIGPHHRWAMGTLFDNIVTDGEINIQDRGNWGTGHGWAGVTQVIWNCSAATAAIQDPWVSGKNYCIGLQAIPTEGRFTARPMTIWEGRDKKGLQPASLFLAQLDARLKQR